MRKKYKGKTKIKRKPAGRLIQKEVKPMEYYKIRYSATAAQNALEKILEAHTAQDAQFIFKTFHEGRMRNVKLIDFQCVSKEYVAKMIAAGYIEQITPKVYKRSGTLGNTLLPASEEETEKEKAEASLTPTPEDPPQKSSPEDPPPPPPILLKDDEKPIDTELGAKAQDDHTKEEKEKQESVPANPPDGPSIEEE